MEIERAQSENMHKLEDRQGYILDKTHHREQTYTDIEEKLKIQRMQKRREKNRME
jgi:inorganic pyrophosphatase